MARCARQLAGHVSSLLYPSVTGQVFCFFAWCEVRNQLGICQDDLNRRGTDKAYAYMKELVDKIREAGKYVFRNNKKPANTNLTTKCRILSLHSEYFFVVVSALTKIFW
jgi:hypothetical protein